MTRVAPSRPSKFRARAWGLAVLLLLISSCDDPKPTSPARTQVEKITVFTTAYPLADIARQVGGQFVTVEWLTESGQPVRIHDPDEDTRNRIRTADLVISRGETFATEGLTDPVRALQMLPIDTLPASRRDGITVPGLIWLDPAVAIQLSRELQLRFTARRASAEFYFKDRAEAFDTEIATIVKEFEDKIRSAPGKRMIVLSDDFKALLLRFSVEPLHPIDAEPTSLTDRQLRSIRDAIRKHGARAMLVSSDTPPAAIRDLAERLDLKIFTLDPLGSSAATGRDTYAKLLRYNLSQLLDAVSVR